MENVDEVVCLLHYGVPHCPYWLALPNKFNFHQFGLGEQSNEFAILAPAQQIRSRLINVLCIKSTNQ